MGRGVKTSSHLHKLKKLVSHIIGMFLGALALLPPFCDEIKIFTGLGGKSSTWNIEIPVIVNSFLWVYVVIFIGLLCMHLWFCKINPIIKVFASYVYIACFFSAAPYISFNAMLLVVPALYLFVLIKNVADKEIIINWIVALFWFEVAMCIMQLLGKDVLLNFNRPGQNVFLGTVMQHMRSGSLFAIMAPFLLLKNKLYIIPLIIVAFLESASNFGLALMGGAFIYFLISNIPKKIKYSGISLSLLIGIIHSICNRGSFITAFSCGRIPVWKKIFMTGLGAIYQGPNMLWADRGLGLLHSLKGWGLDMFHCLYPALIGDANPFAQCHNDWLQLMWEIGWIGLGLALSYFIYLVIKLHSMKKTIWVIGLIMIGINMCFAFPLYMPPQTPLMILAFLALCEQTIKESNYV